MPGCRPRTICLDSLNRALPITADEDRSMRSKWAQFASSSLSFAGHFPDREEETAELGVHELLRTVVTPVLAQPAARACLENGDRPTPPMPAGLVARSSSPAGQLLSTTESRVRTECSTTH